MEQKESQYMAVGRVYATALYDSAQRTGQTADVLADIESIGALLTAVAATRRLRGWKCS